MEHTFEHFLSTFSIRVKQSRLRSGLSQADLAKMSGVAPEIIAGWESGALAPELPQLAAVSVALDVSADYLVGLSDYPT